MGFKCGIVGLPNVGKSTLFNALTRANVEAQNFPFCTIEPNTGIVPMPDPRLDRLVEIVSPDKVIPTTIEFVDIAVLVAGASKGEGLGNQFLGNIRETQAIGHVVRCFEDDQVTHVAETIDPARDIEIINTELQLADLETLERAIDRVNRVAKSGDKEAIARMSVMQRMSDHIDAGKPARTLELNEDETVEFVPLQLLTAKPVLYIANVEEDGFEDNPHLDKVMSIAANAVSYTHLTLPTNREV